VDINTAHAEGGTGRQRHNLKRISNSVKIVILLMPIYIASEGQRLIDKILPA